MIQDAPERKQAIRQEAPATPNHPEACTTLDIVVVQGNSLLQERASVIAPT